MVDYSPYIEGLKRREAERKASLEKRRQKALVVAQQIAEMLRRDFDAKEIYLFGSALRPGEFHAHSDIDLAAEGIAPERYFSAVGRALMMSDEFSVDLLDFSECLPELKTVICRRGKNYQHEVPCYS
ncbi:MAG: nucleotidyltransferase domain-containing protein [candidate division KSB1 bacterium]|nr:nucleotidyltransferase domain-containing protein [candidate division KSB1 bacterium]MDZ7369334.1 nucleotidyltransferase domain-containing protein [candidate division KSB1 bacterium]MDZ7407364.1 nucleotidyltransferase domain-containing protein [candidate division KSB1 bacterium]